MRASVRRRRRSRTARRASARPSRIWCLQRSGTTTCAPTTARGKNGAIATTCRSSSVAADLPLAEPMKIGYKASAEQFGAQELLRFGLLAEECGFDSVTVSDHFQPWRHQGGQAPNAFVWLGALAAPTKRARIGTSVVTPTFRYHPALVAQMAATIQSLAGGRFFLGIGSGESMNEVPLGIEWPEIKERFARMKEAAELMRKLWREDFVTFDGDFYKTKSATIYERQLSGPVPLYIAGTGESAARLAGRVADGFICTSGKGEALYTSTLLPAVRDGATKAGRDPSAIELMIEVKVSYDTDPK